MTNPTRIVPPLLDSGHPWHRAQSPLPAPTRTGTAHMGRAARPLGPHARGPLRNHRTLGNDRIGPYPTWANQNYLGLVGPPIGHKQKLSAKVCTKRSGSSFLGGDMGSGAGNELMNCCSPFFRGTELVAARQPLLALSPGCINHYGVPDVVMGMARVADELATARPGPDGRRGAERQPLGTHAGGAPRTL